MFLYINIMALKVLIVTISIFVFLAFVKHLKELKENFISNIKQKWIQGRERERLRLREVERD